jgi:predicted dehydrogenase
MLNVGVYGLGGWGKRLVASVQGKSEKIRVVACAARTRSNVEQFCSENSIDIVADYAALLKDPRVQGVILATPHSLHPAHVQQAARAGKHAFVEKPLSLTAAAAAETVRVCREHGVKLGIGFNRRFRPAMQELRRLATSGALGRVLHLEGQFSGAPGSRTPGSWRVSRAENPGGSMTARGVHVVDAMISIAGPVSEMLAESSRNVTTAEHDDRTSMLLRFASGATGYLATLSAGPDFWRVHVFGDKGWAEVRDEHLLTVCPEQGAKPVVTEYPATDTLKAGLEAFADAAAGGAPHPVTPEEAVNSSAVLEGIEKSVTSRGWLKLT